MQRKSAFTLIELLVVIAIIAILAAILFPVFAKAREKARMSSCQSNEKQMMTAVIQYTQDYDETYPSSRLGNVSAQSWRVTTAPYIKNKQVFSCPSNPDAKTMSSDGVYTRSYCVNGASSGGNTQPMDIAPQSISAVTAPADVIGLVCIVNRNQGDPEIWFSDSAGGTPNPPYSHLGQGMFAFLDGHVKAMKVTNTINPVNLWDCTNRAPGTNIGPWVSKADSLMQ